MPAKTVHLFGATLAAAAAVTLIAACSSSSSGSGGGTSGAAAPSTPASAAKAGAPSTAVTIRATGSRLVAPNGRTLYFNTVDTASKIQCVGTCASEWPPLTGQPTAGSGVSAGTLGTAARPDGRTQITFRGHPLYEFGQDGAAGEHKGDGLADGGGTWHVATPAGGAAASSAAPSRSATSSASSGGGGGYGYP